MIIYSSHIENKNDNTRMTSIFVDEKENAKKEVFISVNAGYGKYLVSEVLDAFCLAAILPALVSQQDIIVEGAISDYFYYHSKTLIYLLSKVFGYPTICIRCDNIIHINFNPKEVATAFSGGVDSFVTYLNHIGTACPDEFKLTQFALFNIGAYGNNYEKSLSSFQEDVKRAEVFSKKVGLPLVLVDSNIGELYTHKDIYHYALRSTMCLSIGILALQKLWKVYYISSSTTIDDMRLAKYSQSYYVNSITQLLSNNNTSIFVTEADMNRVEKTELIAHNKLAQEFLFVCAADVLNTNNGSNYQKNTAPNCSECEKCARTEITLDYLGVLDEFKERFDLERYYKIKPWLEYQAYCGDNHFQREIYDLMKEKGFKPAPKMEVRRRVGKCVRTIKRIVRSK